MTTPAIPIASSEPFRFAAGESVAWSRAVTDYPASAGWALVYYFAGPSTLEVTAVDDGTGLYVATVTADMSGPLLAGDYRWSAYAEAGSGATVLRVPVASGRTAIGANITSAKAGELLSQNERDWAAVKATISGNVTDAVKAYTIGGRSVTSYDPADLIRLESHFRVRVWRERNPGKFGPRTVVRFA